MLCIGRQNAFLGQCALCWELDVTGSALRCLFGRHWPHGCNVRSCSINCRRSDEEPRNNHDGDEDTSATTTSIWRLLHLTLSLLDNCAERVTLLANNRHHENVLRYCGKVDTNGQTMPSGRQCSRRYNRKTQRLDFALD